MAIDTGKVKEKRKNMNWNLKEEDLDFLKGNEKNMVEITDMKSQTRECGEP